MTWRLFLPNMLMVELSCEAPVDFVREIDKAAVHFTGSVNSQWVRSRWGQLSSWQRLEAYRLIWRRLQKGSCVTDFAALL